jgi:hypothetical protein
MCLLLLLRLMSAHMRREAAFHLDLSIFARNKHLRLRLAFHHLRFWTISQRFAQPLLQFACPVMPRSSNGHRLAFKVVISMAGLAAIDGWHQVSVLHA